MNRSENRILLSVYTDSGSAYSPPLELTSKRPNNLFAVTKGLKY